MKAIATFALPAVFLASCIGDATLFVSGRTTDEKGQAIDDCTVSLYLAANDREVDKGLVGGVWRQEFVVAPRAREYYLKVKCPSGAAGRTGKFTFPTDDINDLDVALGDVVVH